jgi:hypothetical protein
METAHSRPFLFVFQGVFEVFIHFLEVIFKRTGNGPVGMGINYRPFASWQFSKPKRRIEAARLLTGRDDVADFEISGEGNGRSSRVTIRFNDGDSYGAFLKECWEGPLREAAGIESAKALGLPLYGIVVGKNWALVDEVKGEGIDDVSPLSPWLESIGFSVAYAEFLGHSDDIPHHFFLQENGKAVLVDWGSAFCYACFDEDGMRPYLAGADDSALYLGGIAKGRRKIAEKYSSPAIRAEIGKLLEPMNRKEYSDTWTCGEICETGLKVVSNALDRMDALASEWAR